MKLNSEQVELVTRLYEEAQEAHSKREELKAQYERAVHDAERDTERLARQMIESGASASAVISAIPWLSYKHQLDRWLWEHTTARHTPAPATATTDEQPALTEYVGTKQSNGNVTVTVASGDYTVQILGQDYEPWCKHNADVPERVYELLRESYPKLVVLGLDDK